MVCAARRHFLLCDAHVPHGGLVRDGKLLLDFHSFPLRIEEVADQPKRGRLREGYTDAIYGRSKGGLTPSGWRCEHLPALKNDKGRTQKAEVRGANARRASQLFFNLPFLPLKTGTKW
jgi:hypothetical protein